jgi:hypothetical protein
MMRIQEWIYKFEVGEGTRVIRLVLAVLALLALAAVYDLREYKNFSTAEAMDSAQVARNIAGGKGFTTLFVRPLSIHLVEQRQIEIAQRTNDFALLKSGHPDLANPPVYPTLLAGLMKVLPFEWEIKAGTPFSRYQPEVLIALFNQALFMVAIVLVFRLAGRLFDATVAWISALILAGTDLFWQFSVSGLSTLLLVVVFLGLFWCLVEMEQATREGQRGGRWWVMMAGLTGIIVGLGALTRYSFGWLILPVLGFFALFFGQRRALLCLAALVAFAAVVTPWLARNYNVSGTLFGTAGYAIVQNASAGDRLERSLLPAIGDSVVHDCLQKLLLNTSGMLHDELPKLGGSVTTVFFLVGLMVPFVNVGLSRMRIFLIGSLAVLLVVQALGRTHLSADSPEINSENLLVLPAPLIFIFGVGLYSLLLDRLELPFAQLRHLVTVGLVCAASAPLIILLLPPREFPMVYPPYWPPWIQQFSRWMTEQELVMSDMPWATAWYGRRQSVWTTMNVQDAKNHDDFYTINDSKKPVRALYLTPLSMDARFFSQMLKGQDWAWGKFVVDSLVLTNGLPRGFPLKHSPAGPYLNSGHVFLTDWPRWKEAARNERGN